MPFDQGENFAFLGGKDWDPSQVTLPKHVTDALEILLITKDNLAGYHRELVEHFILEDKWGRWIGRWTAEEHLHAIALRNYLVVTREIDPGRQRGRARRARDEGLPRRHLQPARDAGLHGVLRTRPRRVLPQPAGADRPSRRSKALVGRIASDEERHEEFFANIVAHCLTYSRDETIAAIAAPRRRARRRRRRHRRLRRQGGRRRRGRHLRRAQLRRADLRSHHRVGPGRRAAS